MFHQFSFGGSSARRFSLAPLLLILCLTVFARAQKQTWRYVQTVYGGVKIYLADDETATLPNGHRTAWDKRLLSDQSFAVSKVEWDCRNRRRLTLEMTLYRADRTLIDTLRKFEWQSVIPGSVGAVMFEPICLEKQSPQIVEISVREAHLRAFPDARAAVVRTVKQHERFALIPNTGENGWFNIVEQKTQFDYWIEGGIAKVSEPAAVEKEATGTAKSEKEKVESRTAMKAKTDGQTELKSAGKTTQATKRAKRRR